MRYHCLYVLFVLAAVFLGSLAKLLSPSLSPRWDDMHIRHSWNAVPKDWESLGRPPYDTTINLFVALKPRRENALIEALCEVSSPGHPKYGAYLSREQVADIVAPHPNTLELVNSWLEHHDVPCQAPRVSVAQANALLGASYQLYRHVERSETIVRTVGYALPAVLHRHVLTVAPTTSFVSPRRTRWVKSASGEPGVTMLSSRDEFITPSFLRWLYDTSTYKPASTDQNALGIAGYNREYPSPADLATFMRKYRSDAADATFTVVQVNDGGYDPGNPHAEANLDIQYTEAMAYPTPHIFYSTGQGPSGTEDWYVSWLGYILGQRNIPQTITTSYGLDEKIPSKEYAHYVCDLFAQLGARGVSVLFSSGDNGVGQGNCVTNDGSVRFIPYFPATCPWVTAVGGTMGYDPEVAASFSGGGFSDYFVRPDYQERAVKSFFRDLGTRHQGLYNHSGRGFPDIAAQANGFKIFLDGNERVVGGTSGSAPVMAGIISLLNDYLLLKGRSPLGFLNPRLYDHGLEALFDITSGSNPGCGTLGFSAIVGWDPVTGLGTPSLDALQKIFDVDDRVVEPNPTNN